MKSFAIALLLAVAAVRSLEAQQVCGTPGQDGPFTGGGTVNTYYPPLGNVALQPGGTTFDVGTSAGAGSAIAVGNLLLIMQMQDGRFNSSNTDSYGSGVAGPGRGFTDIANAGLYEYVVVTNVAGTTITITGAGPGNGLINKYVNEDFQNAAHTFDENNDGDVLDPEDDHAAHGRRRFQIIRVPQYSTLTIDAQMTCLPWNPTTALGGVLAVDVQSDLVFSGAIDHIDVSQRGFRGAGATRGIGNLGAFVYSSTDFRQRSDQPPPNAGAHGNKGEGISGTPRFLLDPFGGPNAVQDLTIEGYPDGIRARGAPGNAAGGGNSGNPSAGDQESGGGGGGNGGPGGNGGNSRQTNLPVGGRGGAAFPWAANRLAMGGGGGSGQRNDASDTTSHAGSGGGIVLIRTSTVSGVQGRILADGGAAINDTPNDGGGGAGAGGSVLIFARTPGELANVLVFARGGKGGDAGSGNNLCGPGGGGGGGVILASDTLGGADTSAGSNGFTGNARNQLYGSAAGTGDLDVPGDPGNPFVTEGSIPGAGGGAGCSFNDSPNAVDDIASTSTNTLVNIAVLANDSDPESNPLTITLVSDPPNGTAAINGSTIDYTPDMGFTGTDTFTYTISDGNTTDTATVTVTVGNLAPVNTVPAAQSTPEDTALVFTGGTAISVDDPDNSSATIQVALTVTSGTLTLSGTAGLLFSAGDGTADATMTFSGSEADVNAALNGLSFQPALDSVAPVTLTVVTNDLAASNPLSDTDTVDITVTPVNDPPVAVADGYGATAGVARVVAAAQGVLANDTDIEGDTLTAVLVADVTNGTLALNSNGSFTYTSTGAFTGIDSFTYRANDGNVDSGIVTVTITVTNNPPVANDDAYLAVNGTALVVAAPGVLLNDVDLDPLTAVLDVGPANGALTINLDGSFTYTADPGFVGDDTFTYHANDGSGDSNIATVTITVSAAPVLNFPAGYCGLLGLEILAPLGALWLHRRRRRNVVPSEKGTKA